MNKLPFIIFAIFVAIFALVFIEGKDTSIIESVMIGKPVPQFNLPSAIKGQKSFSSDRLKGKVSIVNVFASWCVACQLEHNMLKKITKEENINIYGIDYKDKPENLKKWLDKRGNFYKLIGDDSKGRVAIDWGVYGVPESFIIDKKGIIRYKHVGPLTGQVYKDVFKPLLAELKK